MISSKMARWISVIAGIVSLFVSAHFKTFLVVPCGGLAANYPTVLAFELARTLGDLAQIFGLGACMQHDGTTLVSGLNTVNWWDMAAFIPTYGAFLFFYFLARRDAPLWQLGAALVVVACGADYVEDWCLAGLAQQHTAVTSWLAILPWATAVKWIGLGIVVALGGYQFARAGGLWRWIIALIGIAGFVATVMAIFSPHQYAPYLTGPIALAFVALLVAELFEIVRPPRAA